MFRKIKLWLALRRLRGDLNQEAQGKKSMNKWILAVDVMQVAGLAFSILEPSARTWAALHGPVAAAALALLIAINRQLPAWIDLAKKQEQAPAKQ